MISVNLQEADSLGRIVILQCVTLVFNGETMATDVVQVQIGQSVFRDSVYLPKVLSSKNPSYAKRSVT